MKNLFVVLLSVVNKVLLSLHELIVRYSSIYLRFKKCVRVKNFWKKFKRKIFQYFQEESNTEAYTNRSLLGNFDWNDAANFLVGPNLPSRVRFQNAKTTTVNFDTKFPPYQKF